MNDCCQDPTNRRAGAGPRGLDGADTDVQVTYCIVCECRHFEVDAEPLELGVEGGAL